MITGKHFAEIEAVREEFCYVKRDFNESLALIAEDVEMLRETPNETDIESLRMHFNMLEGEYYRLEELQTAVDLYESERERMII